MLIGPIEFDQLIRVLADDLPINRPSVGLVEAKYMMFDTLDHTANRQDSKIMSMMKSILYNFQLESTTQLSTSTFKVMTIEPPPRRDPTCKLRNRKSATI